MIRTLPLLLLLGCAGASSAAVGSAVLTSAVAVTASAVSRANGGCYASCPPGTRCLPNSGLCEPLPCRGLCGVDQVCLGSGLAERCSARAAEVQLDVSPQRPAYLPAPNNLPAPSGPSP